MPLFVAGPSYALFADVAKAYDQVWRDGLYLTLYSTGMNYLILCYASASAGLGSL